MIRKLRATIGRWNGSPVGLALGAVLLVAAALRLAFLFRAPPFYVGGDSPTYLEPAVQLLEGSGFDPIVKRPPGYPLFLAWSLDTFGWDLQGTAFAQHLLGVATAGLTWALARACFGRLAGLLAGLAVALNGTLVVFEHYVMAEALFLMLLTFAILTLVLAAREPTAARLLLAGLLLGLASATRQSAQALLALAPVALLLAGLHWRRVVRGSLLVLAGFLVVLLPWLAFDYARHGTLSSGTLGETLVWRLTRGEDAGYFRFRPAPVNDPRLQEARRFALGQAADRVLPSDTKVALQQRFDLDEGAADSVLRGLALEAIGRQPDAYVLSSLGLLGEHLVGERQFLGGQGKSGGVTRYSDAQDKYSGFWSERTRPLVQNATPAQEQEFRRAQALTSLQPYRFAWLLLPLLGLGTVATLLRPDLRLGLVPGLAALILLLLAAFLAGDLPRYRYPADPFLAVLEAGAVGWVVGLLAHLVRATRRPRQLSPATARP